MYLIDVLLGKEDERIRRFGHDRISTFGIGTEFSATAWRGIFRQLIARGLLSVDVDGHGGLQLADACRAVLRGEEQLWLRREAPAVKSRTKRSSKSGSSAAGSFSSVADRELWDALRELRMTLAKAQNVPPYVVFHDATLA
jgi:ATP-dependent DNA helicase RecQ